jgi:uncharacterized protein YgbK (DUF1537 family)
LINLGTDLKVGVLADDLTGAFDTGVQFRNWGLSVEVLIGDIDDSSKLGNVDVVVVDTESRGLKPEDAFKRVYSATEKLISFGAEKIYKKVDSTLRGNIGSELDAAMDASKAKLAFFAPAYPTYGRTTFAGRLLVNNTPIDKTEYVNELKVKTSEISAIISVQSKRKIGVVDFEKVDKGIDSIRSAVEELKRGGVEVIVFDVLTEKHLIDISKAAADTTVFIGSAGFASELPIGLGLRTPKPILSICGSTRQVSRIQTHNLHKRLGFREIDVGILKLVDGELDMRGEVERCVGEAVAALEAGVDVSITSAPKEISVEEFISHALMRGVKEADAKLLIEEALGEIASTILNEAEVLGLILIGGATSLMVCQKLKVDRVSIVEEIEPGIPLTRLSNGMFAVTKAGGFGVEDSLVQVTQRLRRLMSK